MSHGGLIIFYVLQSFFCLKTYLLYLINFGLFFRIKTAILKVWIAKNKHCKNEKISMSLLAVIFVALHCHFFLVLNSGIITSFPVALKFFQRTEL